MTTDTQEWERLLLQARRTPTAALLLKELRRRGATIEHDRQGLLLRCDTVVVDTSMMFAASSAVLAVLGDAGE